MSNKEQILEAIKNSHESLEVLGRGTFTVSSESIRSSQEFQKALKRAGEMLTHHKAYLKRKKASKAKNTDHQEPA